MATHLAGINNADYLIRGNVAGQFFENFVISEFHKNNNHFNDNLNSYYINHRNLWEIDLLIEKNLELLPVEVKLSATNLQHHSNTLPLISFISRAFAVFPPTG